MTTIDSSRQLSQPDIAALTWPVTILGGTLTVPVIVSFSEDITLRNINEYFIIGSDNVTIDGGNYTVSIDVQNIVDGISVSGWNGLVKNGINNTSNPQSYSTTIQNINIKGINSSILSDNAGWICWSSFSYGVNRPISRISNCSSSGEISGTNSGGIIGSFAGTSGGSIIVTNCFSSGEISGEKSGGIIGSNGGGLTVTSCYSTGKISGTNSGGICGYNIGTFATVEIKNCYSNGEIFGENSGGIIGPNSGLVSFKFDIENCYSSGTISGTNSGGIFGPTNNTLTTINCYIANGSWSDLTASENLIKTPTYSSGSLVNPIGSVWADIANGSWSDLTASENLIKTPTYSSGSLVNPIGSVWADIAPNNNTIPWIFTTFGYSPYTTELISTFSQSIQQGSKTDEALETSGHTYTIIGINDNLSSLYPGITINSNTGQISVSFSTPINTYNIKVLKNSDYTMTNFDLTVLQGSEPIPIPVPNNNRCKDFYVKLKENEKFIIRLNEVYSRYSLIEKYKIIKNPKYGCLSLNSKNKLVYTPDKNYIGKDKFILKCINLIKELSIEITFRINIKK